MHIVDEPRKFSPSNVLTYTVVTYLSIPNWFELQLVSQLASYLFSYFLLRSLLPFSNSKFSLMSCPYKEVVLFHHNTAVCKDLSSTEGTISEGAIQTLSTSKIFLLNLIGKPLLSVFSVQVLYLLYSHKLFTHTTQQCCNSNLKTKREPIIV